MALRNQEIGARLRELRGSKPQTTVADEIGVAERTYQNWEAGTAKPSYRNLQSIATYYGVGEDYILAGSERALAPVESATNGAGESQLDRIERVLVDSNDRFEDAFRELAQAITDMQTRLDAIEALAIQRVTRDADDARRRPGEGEDPGEAQDTGQ